MADSRASRQAVRDLASAHRAASTVPLMWIMRAKRKPGGVSDARWRMELRRRANPERYYTAGVFV